RIDLADIATGQHGQRAKTDRAAQNPAPVDVVDELAVLGENALVDRLRRPKQRRSVGANGHDLAPSVRCLDLRNDLDLGTGFDLRNDRSGRARRFVERLVERLIDYWPAGDHGD